MIRVIKRDGRVVPYAEGRVANAIHKAATAASEKVDVTALAQQVTEKVMLKLKADFTITVEDIQDIVEVVLIECKHAATAKAYITYRDNRARIRNTKSVASKVIDEIVNTAASDSDMKRENANVDADSTMGSMLKIGSETAKEWNLNNKVSLKHAQMHRDGLWHIHDADFMALTINCLYIPAGRLLKTGFTTGHGSVRSPRSINTAANLVCIIIQSSQNDFFGGQGIPTFDYDLAPFVGISYIKNIGKYLRIFSWCGQRLNPVDDEGNEINYIKQYFVDPCIEYCLEDDNHILDEQGAIFVDTQLQRLFDEAGLGQYYKYDLELANQIKLIKDTAYEDVVEQTNQAMEAVVHNLCTMNSRAGAQVPFSSINFGTDTSTEGRLVSLGLLHAIDNGMGKGETAIFPIAIMKMKKGVTDKGSPNYDIFQESCRVSAKRLYPNHLNLDAPFNTQYYKSGHPETEVAAMGCYTGDGVITVAKGDVIKYLTLRDFCNRKDALEWKVWDTLESRFVSIKNVIINPPTKDWYRVTCIDGTFTDVTGDHRFVVVDEKYATHTKTTRELCLNDKLPLTCAPRTQKAHTPIVRQDKAVDIIEDSADEFEVYRINEEVFEAPFGTQQDALMNLLDKFGERDEHDHQIWEIYDDTNNGSIHALRQIAAWVTTFGLKGILVPEENIVDDRCTLRIFPDPDTSSWYWDGDRLVYNSLAAMMNAPSDATVGRIESRYTPIAHVIRLNKNEPSYCLETETDRFDCNGICAHNCRTRVIGNYYDPSRQITHGRGNLFVLTLSLPYIALQVREELGFVDKKLLVDTFIEKTHEVIDEAIHELEDRYALVAKRHARNYPFMVGQGLYLDSDKLDYDDSIEPILRHGTQTIGFIGLAETLTALIGSHHGETAEAQELGLRIIGDFNDYIKEYALRTGINYSFMASPAEGCTGRLAKLARKRFGIVPGVTDKDYFVNSFHIPPKFEINAYDKVALEAPYHSLCPAGSISYIEIDADTSRNVEGFQALVEFMADSGMGYFSINHPVDRDPVCGYIGYIPSGGRCPRCGRKAGEGVDAHTLLHVQTKNTADARYAISASMIVDE